jgi:hypothetical protein
VLRAVAGITIATGGVQVLWPGLVLGGSAGVHATDAGSAARAVRHTADLAMALLRATGPGATGLRATRLGAAGR